jgi:hypothetical protein
MADSNNEEVKEFTQTVHVEPTKDTENVEDEEKETPPESSEEEKPEASPEEPETPEESEVEEPEEEPAETPEIIPEPKPVEGETPRERALRLELTRVKGIVRDQKRDELFVKKSADSKPENEELAKYDPEQVKNFEKIAKTLGFAKRDEILSQTSQERLDDTFNEFMESHTEYAPENDKDGILWNQFRSEFQLYNPSKDPKTLKKILNKVHNDVYGVQPAKNLNKINASKEKIKVASHTGASAGKETRARTQAPSGLRVEGMKGFSEAEIKELLG